MVVVVVLLLLLLLLQHCHWRRPQRHHQGGRGRPDDAAVGVYINNASICQWQRPQRHHQGGRGRPDGVKLSGARVLNFPSQGKATTRQQHGNTTEQELPP